MLGTKIKTSRTKKNITQEELADALFVSAQAVSKWENNLSIPDIDLLVKLSDYFEVSVDYLVRNNKDVCCDIMPKINLSSTLIPKNSSITVEGTIENTSHVPVSLARIKIDFYDEKDKIVDSKQKYIDDLQEHSSKPFWTISSVRTTVKKVEVSLISIKL